MKTTPIGPIAKRHSVRISIAKPFRPPELKVAWRSDEARRGFNLLLTTGHPESADEGAGEVVCVPAEFAGSAVVVDLHEVTRIDSWGLALFMEAMKRIAARGADLVLVRVHEAVRRILELAKLDQVFRIFSSREEAVADQRQLLAA